MISISQIYFLPIQFRQHTFIPSRENCTKIQLRTFFVNSESEVAQSCLILCDPMDYSLLSFSIHVSAVGFLILDLEKTSF